MKTPQTLIAVALATLAPSLGLAQSIDYGMTAYQVQSAIGTPLPVNTGGFRLYTTNGSFTPSSSSTISDITSNMRLVIGSETTISPTDAGLFYVPSLFPATAAGNIATGAPLFVLASTTSAFDGTAPWALITGSDVGWSSINATDPLAVGIIELSLAGNEIRSAGFGGPGVGAYWNPQGSGTVTVTDPLGANLILVPEPSTYALLSLAGLALGGYAARRRSRA
jgi:hypothetical protein